MSLLLLGIQKVRLKQGIKPFKPVVETSLDMLSHPVLILDNEDKIIYRNPATYSFLSQYFPGSSKVSLTDSLLEILYDLKQSDNQFSKNLNLVTQSGIIEVLVVRTLLKKGQWLFQIFLSADNKNDSKDVNELSQLQSSIDELSYIISHDLIEPVRTIRSFAQIIKTSHISKFNDPEVNEDFDFIIDATDRLYNMIQGMLQYSRLSSKHFPHEETDTLDVLVEVIKDLMAATKEANASIQCSDMPIINFNKTLLTQIFTNLIGNALKYKSEDRNPKIEISAQDLGNEYLFIIQDNGIGIDESQSDRLFKIFQRLHSKDSKYPGTGMGLAICKKIIEREKGKIWFESTPGLGSKFMFTVPK